MSKLQLVAYRCRKCGKIHYPFHDRCMNCKGREFDEVHPEGNAKLLAFTQIFNLPWGFDQRFLIIGVAEFLNGIKAMGQIRADCINGLQPGIELKPSWEPVRVQGGENVYGLKFEPIR